jgi:hypothetical protein
VGMNPLPPYGFIIIVHSINENRFWLRILF